MGFKRLQKYISVLCAIVMILTFTIQVKAAGDDVIDLTKEGSITIHKYDITAAKADGIDVSSIISNGKTNAEAEAMLDQYAIKGVEFTYLRVGSVETMSVNGNVKLVYDLPKKLQTILGLKETDAAQTKDGKIYFTSQQINDALASALLNNTTVKNELEKYISDGTKMAVTDAKGVTSKQNLALGLYLIVETKVPENVTYTTNPWFVQLPMTDYEGDAWFYDIVAYPKNQTGLPTLDKKVRNNPDQTNVVTNASGSIAAFTSARPEYSYGETVTASAGELLDYEFVSKIPHITSTATYLKKYTFTDVLARGITYGQDAVIAFYDSEEAVLTTNKYNVTESGAVTVWTSDSGKFRQTYHTDTDGTSQMIIEMTDTGLEEINTNYSDKYMAVYYTGTVNSDESIVTGDKGNANDVVLEWRRTNTEQYGELKDSCIVYTYGMKLKKTFSDGKGNPTKVKFVLENASDQYFVKANGENGEYYINGKTDVETEATKFSPAADGTLIIHGLEGDSYTITETHTDTGYSVLKEPLTMQIIPTKAEANFTQITGASAKVDEMTAEMETCSTDNSSVHALVKLSVLNSKGFFLPQTGGRGLYFVTVLGVLIAATGLLNLSKKSKE